MNPSDSYDVQVVQQLEQLKSIPAREAQRAQAGRAAFLQEARQLAQAVSAPAELRPIEWKQKILSIFSTRKERSPMLSSLTTLLLVLTLIFGGSGITLASAQSSLPDQPLYNLKLWSEELRFNLARDPQAAWQLAESFAERRGTETQAMLAAGQAPSQAVQARYQSQIEQTTRLAAGLPADQALGALEQIRQQLRQQEQSLSQLQLQNNTQAEAARQRLQSMLQARIRSVEAGIERQQQRNGGPAQAPGAAGQPGATLEPSDELNPGGVLPAEATTGAGGNPWTSATPTPYSGYGPGPGDGTCDACTPNAGENNPWTTGVPTPGSGYGPGPGDGTCETCTPAGGSYGPNPTQGSAGGAVKTQQPAATQAPANTRAPHNNPTQGQPQDTDKGPGPQNTPGGGKHGG
jgi:Domain of unknown function (DUF5667)